MSGPRRTGLATRAQVTVERRNQVLGGQRRESQIGPTKQRTYGPTRRDHPLARIKRPRDVFQLSRTRPHSESPPSATPHDAHSPTLRCPGPRAAQTSLPHPHPPASANEQHSTPPVSNTKTSAVRHPPFGLTYEHPGIRPLAQPLSIPSTLYFSGLFSRHIIRLGKIQPPLLVNPAVRTTGI